MYLSWITMATRFKIYITSEVYTKIPYKNCPCPFQQMFCIHGGKQGNRIRLKLNVLSFVGASSVADPLRMTEIRPSKELTQNLVAVSHATKPDELLTVNVAGFLYITNIDMATSTITYLAPCPGNLPGKFILVGTLKVFFEWKYRKISFG